MTQYWISTTIKKKWMDKILSGEKKIEYKENSIYWKKRLKKILNNFEQGDKVAINFLCGQKSYKYEVVTIRMRKVKEYNDLQNIDGVLYSSWWEIQLGDRIC